MLARRLLTVPAVLGVLIAAAALAMPSQLMAPTPAASDGYGTSVALNSDGTRLLVGASAVPYGISASDTFAYLYTLSSGQWQLTATLDCNQGSDQVRVALSADGDTALVAGNTGICLFQAASGTWAATPSVVATIASSVSAPTGVALSSDGSTALVGIAGGGSRGTGTSSVYQATGGVWAATPTAVATLSVSANDELGFAVALSADGNTALVTDPFAVAAPGCTTGGTGAGYIFQASGGIWAAAPAVVATLSPPSNITDQCYQLGLSAALSADGNTALLGAPHFSNGGNGNPGSAFVFEASSGIWAATPGAVAHILSVAGKASLGQSVALSADGLTALLGDHSDNVAVVVQAVNGTWPASPVLGVGFTGNNCSFASSLVLSGDGLTGVAGAPSCSTAGDGSVFTTAVAPAVFAAPTATAGTLTVAESTSGSGMLSATPASASDTLTYSIAAQAGNGTVTLTDASTGAYSYTPTAGFYGADRFTFNATDNQNGLMSSTTTVSITVTQSGGGGGGGGYGGGGGGALSWLVLTALLGLALGKRSGHHPLL